MNLSKRAVFTISLVLASASAVAAGINLFDQYRERAQMALTAEQGGVINFLDLLEFSKQSIIKVEMLSGTQFVLLDREGDICVGDTSEAILRCKNKIGFPGVTSPDEATAEAFAKNLAPASPTNLFKEFQRREQIPLSQQEREIIAFLIKFQAPPQEVEELEILNPPTSFVIKVRNGDICLGELSELLLRCKNEIGITSVGFQGDAD